MRLFIAIPLAESVQSQLKQLTNRLKPAAPNLRWSSPESWHITLQFLGATSDEQYTCLLPRLSALKASPIPIEFESLGTFERAGVFILKVAPTSPLVALQKRVVAATQPCGFEQEDRPYRPHITLARAKLSSRGPHGQVFVRGVDSRSSELRTLLERAGERTSFEQFKATVFRLYESHLSAAESKYEVKRRFPLGE